MLAKPRPSWGVAVVLTLVALFLSAAASPFASPETTGEVVLTTAHNGKEVTLPATSVLVVRLPAELGAGYAWRIRQMPADLQLVGDDVEPASYPGSSSTQVLRFLGVSKGRVTLSLVYRRPWETSAAGTDYTVYVRVEGAFRGEYQPVVV